MCVRVRIYQIQNIRMFPWMTYQDDYFWYGDEGALTPCSTPIVGALVGHE